MSRKHLCFGDVIVVNVPYEENTYDYYNGHHPKSIRSHNIKDRNGNESKLRPVMIVGKKGGYLWYIPLTSHHGNSNDKYYQYLLMDNHITPQSKKFKRTYVETLGMRCIKLKMLQYKFQYCGRLSDIDIKAIKLKLTSNSFLYGVKYDKRDKRGWIEPYKIRKLKQALIKKGYKPVRPSHDYDYQFQNKNHTLSGMNNGLIYYHYEITIEELKQLLAM